MQTKSSNGAGRYPGGARFAFTIMDDTDVATVANAGPFYDLLAELGLRTTKTAWPVGCPEGSANFSSSETLEDAGYLAFVKMLHERGFEIASHCATMESSERDRTELGIRRFEELLGEAPRVHANHAWNRENLYWGVDRLDDPVLRRVYRRWNGQPPGYYLGHVPSSPFWWGDLCQQGVTYVRNLTFTTLNVLAVNPSMPYHDPSRPLVRYWFSGADAEDVKEFNSLLRPEAQDRLEREGGVCILATHIGKGFVENGRVHPETERLLRRLAERRGWFAPVGEILDWLHARRDADDLPPGEWRRMQWRWARDLARRKWSHRMRRSRGEVL
jgi:hypothetical protein